MNVSVRVLQLFLYACVQKVHITGAKQQWQLVSHFGENVHKSVRVSVCCTSLRRGSRNAELTLHLGRFPWINSADVWVDGDGEGRACNGKGVNSNKRYSESIGQRQQTSEKHQRDWFKHRLFSTYICYNFACWIPPQGGLGVGCVQLSF